MSLNAARNDWARFLRSGGFQTEVTIKTPNEATSAIISAMAIKHHLSIDTDGRDVSARNAHVTLVEQDLLDEGYPVRDAKGEVNLMNHLIEYADSTGSVKQYAIKRQYPDETVGIISLILGDYGS